MLRPTVRLVLLTLTLALSLLAAACGIGRPHEPALLTPGLADAQVPDAELEAFAYIRASSPSTVPPQLGFSTSLEAVSLVVWLAPWEQGLVLGATLELPSPGAAQLAASAFDSRQGRAIARERYLAVVLGNAPAAESLAAAIERQGLVALGRRNPGALDVLAWLPSQADAPPLAVAYARLSDEALVYLAQRTGSQDLATAAESLRGVRISRATVAFYSQEPLDLQSLGDLERTSHGVAGIAVAPARLPGWIVSTVLGSSAGSAGLEPAPLPGKPVFTRMLGPQRLYLTTLDNKLYLAFSRDDPTALSLLDSVRDRR